MSSFTNPQILTTQIDKRIDEFLEKGFGWVLEEILFTDVYTMKYLPVRGSCSIATPKHLAEKKAIVNVKNDDDRWWAILSALHPVERNPDRVTNYVKYQYENELNVSGINCAVKADKHAIEKFEKQNKLAINIYTYDTRLAPLIVTKNRDQPNKIIHLLLLTDKEKQRYRWIKNLDRLLATQTNEKCRKFICPFCLFPFRC